MRIWRAVFNHALQRYKNASGKPFLVANPVDVLSHQRACTEVERRTLGKKKKKTKINQRRVVTTPRCTEPATTGLSCTLVPANRLRPDRGPQTLTWGADRLQRETLTITDTKNDAVHRLPFSDAIEELLKTRELRHQERSYVFFPSDAERGHLSRAPDKRLKRVSTLSGVTFTTHDLRRTFNHRC